MSNEEPESPKHRRNFECDYIEDPVEVGYMRTYKQLPQDSLAATIVYRHMRPELKHQNPREVAESCIRALASTLAEVEKLNRELAKYSLPRPLVVSREKALNASRND